MKIYRVIGELLSPIHIGTGKVWEPLDYYIDSAKNRLYPFSSEKILTQLNEKEKQEFYNLIEDDDIDRIRQFIIQKAKSLISHNNGRAILATPSVSQLYKDKIHDIHNQLLIQPMIRLTGHHCVYIPGSSLKGAIRTAIVSELAQVSGLPKPKPFGREVWNFESDVLKCRDAKSDPFRAVKLADANLDDDASFVCQVANARRDRNGKLDATSIQLIHEVTHSVISSEEYGKHITFETELRLDDGLMNQKGGVSQRITLDQILDSCNRFYKDKMDMEHEKFYDNSQSLAENESKKLFDQAFDKNECLIRVGRFSGVESVTLDEYRDPQPPGREKKWGTSRNIADGKYPMGWVKLRIIEK